MYNAQDWKITPFKVLGGSSAGLVAGVAYAANGIVFSQSADYNVVRSLSISHDLGLRQTDYWFESLSDPMAMFDAASHARHRPLTASHTLGISDNVTVAGGRVGQSTIHEGVANGVVLAGQAVYMQASGYLAVTEADDETKASVAGVAYQSGGGVFSGPLFYLTDGELELSDWSQAAGVTTLTPGAVYYLDPSYDGRLTSTAPTADGVYVVKVGRALTTTMLDIELGEGVGL